MENSQRIRPQRILNKDTPPTCEENSQGMRHSEDYIRTTLNREENSQRMRPLGKATKDTTVLLIKRRIAR